MKATATHFVLLSVCILTFAARSHDAVAQANGIELKIDSPLPAERFVAGESVDFKAVASHGHADLSQIVWTSDIAGELGRGAELQISTLGPGNHRITARLGALTQQVSVREFKDLAELYRAIPAPAEVERILKTFGFRWTDGYLADEKWEPYDPPAFDRTSYQPNKLPVLARLDVLRHQAFSEPLPFSDGLSIYEHLRKNVNTLNMRLDCGNNSGGKGTISLNRSSSEWWNISTDGCKIPSPPNQPPGSYLFYIVVHEGRHSERDDPGHIWCRGQINMDADLDHGSGHAWAALYAMWIYKYGIYDSPEVKKEARAVAYSLLRSRFCSPPHSSNPKVQAIVDELMTRASPPSH